MPADLDFNGERYIPGTAGDIAYEHWHRYAFARRFAAGRRVLDAACGEGYGTALLAAVAADAIGVDVDPGAIAHARAVYGGRPRARFVAGSVTALPLPGAAIDLIISFETIEHLAAPDQPRMLDEFARVLAPGGLLIISSPNKRRYSDETGYRNPFHLHELYRDDLERLLAARLPHRRWFHQQVACASTLWAEDTGTSADGEAWTIRGDDVVPAAVPDGVYYVVVAAATPGALPPPGPRLSLCSDVDETELARHAANARDVLRLDGLLIERNGALDRQTAHIAHLERLVALRERIVEERDGTLAQQAARAAEQDERIAAAERAVRERDRSLADAAAARAAAEAEVAGLSAELTESRAQNRRLDAAIAAQERIIDYREGLRWWVRLPGLALARWWRRRW
jgi:SAM-dependent methyltransferase